MGTPQKNRYYIHIVYNSMSVSLLHLYSVLNTFSYKFTNLTEQETQLDLDLVHTHACRHKFLYTHGKMRICKPRTHGLIKTILLQTKYTCMWKRGEKRRDSVCFPVPTLLMYWITCRPDTLLYYSSITYLSSSFHMFLTTTPCFSPHFCLIYLCRLWKLHFTGLIPNLRTLAFMFNPASVPRKGNQS